MGGSSTATSHLLLFLVNSSPSNTTEQKMAMIVDTIASQFANSLATLIKDEATMMMTVKDDLRRLQNRVRMMHGVLKDAERKAIREEAILTWLTELKDAVYDADDIIDHSRTDAENLARASSNQQARCYSPLVSLYKKLVFRHQMGKQIQSLNSRLEEIFKERSDFGLNATAPSAPTEERGSAMIHRYSDPDVEADIVGGEITNDANKMVSMMTAGGFPLISIYAIVGMGGIGKTTLAQMIVNHKAIKDKFQLPPPVWINVSKAHSDVSVLKSIIKHITGRSGDTDDVGELQHILAQVVNGKQLFLILDDVWDARIWEGLLKKPLSKAGANSRVLISSRDERVAMQMGAVYRHQVRPLSVEDGWSLLCKLVFRPDEDDDRRALQDIGKQIVDKCRGLPLAIKTIAGVLRDKEKRRSEWDKVLKNPAWSMGNLPEGVMGVLYLSYEDLASHLKQCFIFCSLFPGDHVFMRHTLVQYWVAHGFVKEQKDMILEEVAKEYYRELLQRNLLQRDPRYYDEGGCRMHDLLRSLAQFLSHDEYFTGDVQELAHATSSSPAMKLRHLSVLGGFMDEFPAIVKEQTSVRTLLFMGIFLMKEVPEDLFQKLGRLRLLDLRGTTLSVIPGSIGKLVHLRYIDLSHSLIEELPESIGGLSNLQYLILQKCEELYELPRSITKLYKLRSLDLHKTPVIGMPSGMEALIHLNRLMGFATNESGGEGGGEWCTLEVIKSFTQLRTVTIANLEKATRGKGSLLKDKSKIYHLDLSCSDEGWPYGEEDAKRIQEVFEERLFPPTSVEKFELKRYFGIHFPRWMMDRNAASLLPNLRRLDLSRCRFCIQLPPLGQLPQLDLFDVEDAWGIRVIGPEFMANQQNAFPKLKTLKLRNMPNWAEWIWDAKDYAVAMPKLESLQIVNCPALKALPNGLMHHAKALNALWIEEAHSLSVIEGFETVQGALLIGNNGLERVSGFPQVQTMKIDGCPRLLQDVGKLPSLQVLEWGDSEMEYLPDWLLPKADPIFPKLERLLATVGKLRTLRRCLMDGEDWAKIQYIPNVYIQVMNRPEFIFYAREPFAFNTNVNAADPSTGLDEDGKEEEEEEEDISNQP